MNTRHLLPMILATLFVACGDSPHIENTRPVPDPVPPVPEVTNYYVSPASSGCSRYVTFQQGGSVNDYIGHGYDVTGEYLAFSSVRPAVVDVKKLRDDAYSIFSAPAYNSGETYLGKDAAALLADLMADMGVNISSSRANLYFTSTLGNASANSSFILDTQWNRATIAGFPGVWSAFGNALSDEFTADVALLSGEGLVKKYGTHFISRASMGYAVRKIYSAYLPSANSDLSALLDGYKYAYSSMTGSFTDDLSATLASLYNYGASLQVIFCGGDASKVQYDNGKEVLSSLDSWWESGNSSNQALLHISDIHPLSDAVADKELARQVDAAIERHIAASQSELESIIPLFQNTNGRIYRYVTTAEASSALDKTGIRSFGVLGALAAKPTGEASLPLYSNSPGADDNQILSLIQPTDDWKLLGYVMKQRTEKSVPLYEIYDGTRYAYTIEAKNSYGENNEWHPTGAVFYLLHP